MTTIRYRREASDDLDEIWAYYADYDQAAANRMMDRLADVVRRLSLFPRSGRPRDALAPGLRSVRVTTHVIFYQVDQGIIEIVRVLHGRRDFDAVFAMPK
jgi:toxin ParE1/3/4